MSWAWKLRRDHEGTLWEAVGNEKFFGVEYGFCILDRASHSSYPYSHRITEITTELSPIQARLYRLVYGSLP